MLKKFESARIKCKAGNPFRKALRQQSVKTSVKTTGQGCFAQKKKNRNSHEKNTPVTSHRIYNIGYYCSCSSLGSIVVNGSWRGWLRIMEGCWSLFARLMFTSRKKRNTPRTTQNVKKRRKNAKADQKSKGKNVTKICSEILVAVVFRFFPGMTSIYLHMYVHILYIARAPLWTTHFSLRIKVTVIFFLM